MTTILIIICMACGMLAGAIYLTTKLKTEPDPRIAKLFQMQAHQAAKDHAQDNFAANIKERLDETTAKLTGIETKLNEIEAISNQLNELSGRSNQNDAIIVEKYNLLADQLRAVIAKPVRVEFPEMKSIGVSRVIKRNGKFYRQEVIKHKKLEKSERVRPVIKEIKDKIVENNF